MVEGPNFWAESRRRGCLLCFRRPVDGDSALSFGAARPRNGDRAWSNGRNFCVHVEGIRQKGLGRVFGVAAAAIRINSSGAAIGVERGRVLENLISTMIRAK